MGDFYNNNDRNNGGFDNRNNNFNRNNGGYDNRNNNFNRNNGGYNGNGYYKKKKYNNNKYYNDRNNGGNDNRPQNKVLFDASKNKIPDFMIKDLNGKCYTIKGNFDTGFRNELIATVDRIKAIKPDTDNIKDIPEVLNILKTWCLGLINLNPTNTVFTMDDVNSGFDDIETLVELTYFIFDMVAKQKVNEKKMNTIVANLSDVAKN